jgi:hypothetical protein
MGFLQGRAGAAGGCQGRMQVPDGGAGGGDVVVAVKNVQFPEDGRVVVGFE